MQFSKPLIDHFIVLADATQAVATSPQVSANSKLYETLKDFQPMIAAGVALIAAVVAVYAARTNYRSAQDVAKRNIEYQNAQAQFAYHNKQTGIVGWLYLRTAECRLTIDKYMFRIQYFCSNFELMAGLDMRHIGEESFKKMVADLSDMEGVYEASGLKEVDLEFLVTLDAEDQNNYYLISQNLLYFDSNLQAFVNFTQRLGAMGQDDGDRVYGQLKSFAESVKFNAGRHRSLQDQVSKRMDKLRSARDADRDEITKAGGPQAGSAESNLT